MNTMAALARMSDHLADACNRGGAALVSLVRLVLATMLAMLCLVDLLLELADRALAPKTSTPEIAFDGVQLADLERIG